jgi:hypothetical protein
MKRLTALALASVSLLAACSSSNTKTATTEQNWNSRTQNTTAWNQSNLQKSQNCGTVLSKMDQPTQEWFMSTLPKTEHAELFRHHAGPVEHDHDLVDGPGEQAETSTGTASNTATMQRFVQQEFLGEMFPGMTFQGFALFGYNSATGQYESVWCDNTSTAITSATGTKQKDGSILWTGTFVDPNTGSEKASKATLSFNGRNAMTYTVWDCTETGKEFASLKVDYTRDQTASTYTNTSNTRTSQAPVNTTTSKKPWPTNLRHVAGVNEGRSE